MTYDHTDDLIDGLSATARSIRDEAAAVSEYIGRLIEAVAALRSKLDEAENENSELRAALASSTIDTTTTKDGDR